MTNSQSSISEGGDELVVEHVPAEDSFAILGHEIRLRTLQTLNDADGPLSFSTLRTRVGIDDPGQFNYHLGKLTNQYVRKVVDADSDARLTASDGPEESYELTMSGRRVVGVILSGETSLQFDPETEPIPVDANCLQCGTPMAAHFRRHGITITCSECGFEFTDPEIPAGAVADRSRAEIPTLVDQWIKRNQASAERGFCELCNSRVAKQLILSSDPNAPSWLAGGDEDAAKIQYTCDRCEYGWYSSVDLTLISHPAVIAFHYDHGVDLREVPMWELEWFDGEIDTVNGTDPVQVEVSVSIEGETLTLTVDRDGAVVNSSRAAR